jgi:hypothetical protein
MQFGTNNYVNGHNSYRASNRPEEMYSPYIGNEANSLWSSLLKGTP